MTSDLETLRVYEHMANDYAQATAQTAADPLLDSFIAGLPKGGHALDLGCGPSLASARMADAGLVVTATDAAPRMVAMAAAHPGVTARLSSFDDVSGVDLYDGIWANFSLLHAPRADMPRHLLALHTALKPGGLFHIALKSGTGEGRDTLGRYYSYYCSDALRALLVDAGFTPVSTHTGTGTGLSGQIAPWVAVVAHG